MFLLWTKTGSSTSPTVPKSGRPFITASGFLIYNKSINNNQNEMMKKIENNGQMQRPNGNMGEPPEKPQGDFRPTMQNNEI